MGRMKNLSYGHEAGQVRERTRASPFWPTPSIEFVQGVAGRHRFLVLLGIYQADMQRTQKSAESVPSSFDGVSWIELTIHQCRIQREAMFIVGGPIENKARFLAVQFWISWQIVDHSRASVRRETSGNGCECVQKFLIWIIQDLGLDFEENWVASGLHIRPGVCESLPCCAQYIREILIVLGGVEEIGFEAIATNRDRPTGAGQITNQPTISKCAIFELEVFARDTVRLLRCGEGVTELTRRIEEKEPGASQCNLVRDFPGQRTYAEGRHHL
jgi:hypothetical protein